MPTYYSKPLVDQINGILNMDVKEQSIVTGWIEILKIFKENGIIKGEKRLIHTKHVLCHPKNRAGFMLNGFNSHANGLKVKKVGANRSELHGAVAMERSPFPEERAKELAANKAVAEGSNGLIPMPDGNEDFMSLGTGHMVAFVRASNAGCRTPFKELQDATGHISKEILCRDPEFKAMIEEGWEFIVLPWQVGATWPQLAEFAQRALNASNSVATDATEWEVAITMVEVCEGMEKPDWALAQGAALAGNPSCMSYGNAIRTIAELYAGGPGAPLLHEQDEFVKTMGENRRLGEEFSSAIAKTAFHPHEPRIHLRHCLISANLVSTDVQDGVVKFIIKGDLSKLAMKTKWDETKEADDLLKDMHVFASGLLQVKALSRCQFIDVVGLCRVRAGAFLTKKGHKTFEKMTYASLCTFSCISPFIES